MHTSSATASLVGVMETTKTNSVFPVPPVMPLVHLCSTLSHTCTSDDMDLLHPGEQEARMWFLVTFSLSSFSQARDGLYILPVTVWQFMVFAQLQKFTTQNNIAITACAACDKVSMRSPPYTCRAPAKSVTRYTETDLCLNCNTGNIEPGERMVQV